MLTSIENWLIAHPLIRTALYTALSMLALALLGAWVNWVTWKPTDADWQKYKEDHPRRAFWLGVSRAIFPHLRKIPQLRAYFDAVDPEKPAAPVLPPLLLLAIGMKLGVCLCFVLAIGCAGSFEEARLVSHPQAAPTTPEDRARCRTLDDSRITWGGAAKVLGAAAGGVGLASLPIKSEAARDTVLGVSVVSGIAAAGAVYLSEQKGSQWARECQ